MAPPQVDAEYLEEIKKARSDLSDQISKNKTYAPQMLRLALHDAVAYDPEKKKMVGPNGSTRMEKVIDEPLKKALDFCGNLKKEKYKKITYADLYQLAGVVAIEVTKGPTIVFSPGREDLMEYQQVLERLIPHSDLDAQQLRKSLVRIDLNAREFVALCGGLYGLVSPQAQGTDGLKFGNFYFKDLIKTYPPSNPEEMNKHSLMADKDFREIVELYEKNEDRFLADYATAHKKVSELGLITPSAQGGTTGTAAESAPSSKSKGTAPESEPSGKSGSWNRARLAQGAIGIALATTVVILGYFLSRRSK